jgi:gas vesicle protein
MRRIFGFLIGLFVGWLFGSTIAVLMAPESGEDLRSRLRGRASGFLDEIRFAADVRRAELERHLAELRAPRA